MNYKLPVLYSRATSAQRREVREQYAREQNGLCYWCNQPLSGNPDKSVVQMKLDMSLFPPGFLRHPVHLQHNHDSDLTEGAVHAKCNGVMWQYYGR